MAIWSYMFESSSTLGLFFIILYENDLFPTKLTVKIVFYMVTLYFFESQM